MPSPRPSARGRRRHPVRALAAPLAAGLLALGLPVAQAPAIAAQAPVCMPADGAGFTGLHGEPTFTDDNVTAYAGGNAQFFNAESEGLIVVEGDAVIDRYRGQASPGGVYNLGYVGVGSQSVPADGSLMLAVGGNLTVEATTILHVGRTPMPVGTYMVAGTTTGAIDVGTPVPYDQTGTTAHTFGTAVTAASQAWQAALPTGTVTATGGGAWDPVLFEGDGTSALQIFDLDIALLAGTPDWQGLPTVKRALDFTGIPAGASVIVNVVGGPDVSLPSEYTITVNGTATNYATPEWASFTQHLMWNFPDQQTVSIGTTNSQFTGSVLLGNPAGSLTARTSLNGRAYSAGDLTVEGQGVEIHSFPFKGYAAFDCMTTPAAVATGTFTVAKALTGPEAAIVPGTTAFTVTYTVNGTPAATPLTITADGAVVPGPTLATGDVVVLTETTPLPSVAGVTWGAVTMTVDGVPTDRLTIGDATTATVVVTNTAETPTGGPTDGPTDNPTDGPTDNPTGGPGDGPTDNPTGGPGDGPTDNPTDNPTDGPADGPADNPTDGPTDGPTPDPTADPTGTPTADPAGRPADLPWTGTSLTPLWWALGLLVLGGGTFGIARRATVD